MTAFVSAADVRGYMNTQSATDNWSDGNLGSNIRTASEFLQRETRRQFEAQTSTLKTFTTNGRVAMAIPDLRTVTSVSLQGAALTANSSYYLTARPGEPTFTTIQFRAFGGDYRSNPEWFDRNLDWYQYRGYSTNSLPNDLAITGDWGFLTLPDELLHVTKVLAAFYALRRDSVLANVRVTPEGAILNYADLPPEVTEFIRTWRAGEMAAIV